MTVRLAKHCGERLLAGVAVLMLGAAALPVARGQTGPLVIGGARASAPAAALSRDELRECLRRNDDLTRRTSGLNARVEQLHAEDAALHETSQKLDEIKKRLADTSDDLIEDYNQLVFDYNLRTGSVRAKRLELQHDIDQLESDRLAFNAACAGRPVRKADQDAVMRERAQAQAAASAPPR